MKSIKTILTLSLTFILSVSLVSLADNAKALDDYINADDETQYGWYLQGTEENQACWEFDESGNLVYSYAADGTFGDSQHVNNFAIRNLAINANDTYSVQCTFVPSEDTNASIERTYGVVCWYQDSDNYLIYWLQQKSTQWSGQFYGRINGYFRSFYIPEQIGNIEVVNYWRQSEFADMWWDDSKANNAKLVGNTTALCTNTVTLKVESEIVDLTLYQVYNEATDEKEDQTFHCRKFTLHEIVDGSDFKMVYYVKELNENTGNFYTGIYSNGFNYEVKDFGITTTTTNFAKNVEETISLLPEKINNVNNITTVEIAYTEYNDLLSYKANVSAESVTKLNNAVKAVGEFVDDAIANLDDSLKTYKEDVNEVLDLYSSLPEAFQDEVLKADELAKHVNALKDWTYTDPEEKRDDDVTTTEEITTTEEATTTEAPSADVTTTAEETTTTAEESATSAKKKGCGSVISAVVFLPMAALGACLILKRKESYK